MRSRTRCHEEVREMRYGPKSKWLDDERKHSFPHVAYALSTLVDKNKSEHRGWFVLEAPTIKDLKQYVKDNLFVALEADECPFRMTYEGRQLNWPLGIKEIEIKRII